MAVKDGEEDQVHERMEHIMLAGTRVRQELVQEGIRLPVLQEVDSDVPMLVEQVEGRRRKMYCWRGQLHNVPENFKIPRMTLHFGFVEAPNPIAPPCNMPEHSTFPKKNQ